MLIKDESKVRQNLAHASERVETLKQALAAGANVDEQLQQAEAELKSLGKHLARGDILSFCVLGVFITLSVLAIYFFASNPMLIQLWGSPEHPYLQQFRSGTALIWRTCQMLSGSVCPIAVSVTILVFIWVVQSKMERRSARMLLLTLTSAALFLNAVLVLTFFRLLSLPLG